MTHTKCNHYSRIECFNISYLPQGKVLIYSGTNEANHENGDLIEQC